MFWSVSIGCSSSGTPRGHVSEGRGRPRWDAFKARRETLAEREPRQVFVQTLNLLSHQMRTLRVRTLSWPGMVPRPQK